MATTLRLFLFLILGTELVSNTVADSLCKDLEPTGCQLFIKSQADFCTTSPLAASTCPRSCNLCPLTCYHCPTYPINATRTCNTTKNCAQNELCMINTLYASDHHTEHIVSCIGKDRCDGNGFGFNSLIGKRHESRDISLHCCNTDLCNALGYVPPTTNHPQTTVTIPNLQNCRKDIVFVVDESSTVGYDGFHKIIDFITDIVTGLDIGTHGDQVSLLLFDYGPHLQWYLNDYTSKADLLNALTYVPYHNGSTQTDQALKFVRENVLQFQNGDRPSADNVVVVITDGRSNNHQATVSEAKLLRNQGVEIIALGVGNAANYELVDIAGSQSQALKVLGFDHLPNAEAKVLQLIC
ncbi:hypothetical protein ACF0H5_011551 [Mactra antiquata]